MFGLFLIAVANVIAALGYVIMPDKTPDANDGSLYIKKKTPIFSVQMLKERKNMEVDEPSFLEGIYFGKESPYTIFPLAKEPELKDDSVFFVVNGEKTVISLPLVQIVKPLLVGPANELGNQNWPDSIREPFYILGDTVHYINSKEQLQSIAKEDLEREFKLFNLEHKTYWLGTDKSGRDMLSRLLAGTRISLSIGFVSVLISLLLGVTMGATAGFFGGRTDSLIMWFMTVLWSIPSIMLVIIISIALQSKGIWVAFVAVGMTMWVDVARVVRGQIMGIKEKLYIEAAKAFGISSRRIIFKHMLPNILGPLIVISTSNFAAAILIEAGLSFLGLGVQAPTPSWGIMINEGFDAIGTRDSWHLVLLPSLCIFAMVLAFNLFGNGLRDAYDPQNMK
ncbi:MAG: ABC-type dipeptide/oligopeptide/nickel transport system permease subunit [Arenicella sp.]|jgi:ABC-type dipeptide/oligopeptide/nickel transport system permease subunit